MRHTDPTLDALHSTTRHIWKQLQQLKLRNDNGRPPSLAQLEHVQALIAAQARAYDTTVQAAQARLETELASHVHPASSLPH